MITLETNFGSISASPLERLEGAAESLALVAAAMMHVLLSSTKMETNVIRKTWSTTPKQHDWRHDEQQCLRNRKTVNGERTSWEMKRDIKIKRKDLKKAWLTQRIAERFRPRRMNERSRLRDRNMTSTSPWPLLFSRDDERDTHKKKRSLLQHCILFFLFKTKYKSLVRSARKISSRSASSRSDTNTTLSEESSAPLMRRGRRSTPSSVDRGHLFYFLFFFFSLLSFSSRWLCCCCCCYCLPLPRRGLRTIKSDRREGESPGAGPRA